jgi:hypothetical protein
MLSTAVQGQVGVRVQITIPVQIQTVPINIWVSILIWV